MAQRLPEQLAVAGPAPVAGGDAEVMGGEVLDDRQGRAGSSKRAKTSRIASWTSSSGSRTTRPAGS